MFPVVGRAVSQVAFAPFIQKGGGQMQREAGTVYVPCGEVHVLPQSAKPASRLQVTLDGNSQNSFLYSCCFQICSVVNGWVFNMKA